MERVLKVPVATWSRDDVVGYIDEMAQKRLHISARELFRRYREGRLEDHGEVADLLVIADMLPEDDPLFAPA